LVEALKSL